VGSDDDSQYHRHYPLDWLAEKRCLALSSSSCSGSGSGSGSLFLLVNIE